jgi:Trk-type K+ transport system membrane component
MQQAKIDYLLAQLAHERGRMYLSERYVKQITWELKKSPEENRTIKLFVEKITQERYRHVHIFLLGFPNSICACMCMDP